MQVPDRRRSRRARTPRPRVPASMRRAGPHPRGAADASRRRDAGPRAGVLAPPREGPAIVHHVPSSLLLCRPLVTERNDRHLALRTSGRDLVPRASGSRTPVLHDRERRARSGRCRRPAAGRSRPCRPRAGARAADPVPPKRRTTRRTCRRCRASSRADSALVRAFSAIFVTACSPVGENTAGSACGAREEPAEPVRDPEAMRHAERVIGTP